MYVKCGLNYDQVWPMIYPIIGENSFMENKMFVFTNTPDELNIGFINKSRFFALCNHKSRSFALCNNYV